MAWIGIVVVLAVVVMFLTFITAILVLILKWRSIMVKLYPERYAECNMVQLDDSKLTEIVKKNESLVYEFNGSDYFMFYPPEDLFKDDFQKKDGENVIEYQKRISNLVKNKNIKSTVFRCGGIASFTYVEGNPWPIDFRDLKKVYSNTTRIQKEFNKVQLSQMVASVKENLLDNNMVKYILIGMAVIVIILLFRNPKVIVDASTLAPIPP